LRDDATAGDFELEPADPDEPDEPPGDELDDEELEPDGADEAAEDGVVAFLISPTWIEPLMVPPSSSLTRRA
jgi:hypothetical protein